MTTSTDLADQALDRKTALEERLAAVLSARDVDLALHAQGAPSAMERVLEHDRQSAGLRERIAVEAAVLESLSAQASSEPAAARRAEARKLIDRAAELMRQREAQAAAIDDAFAALSKCMQAYVATGAEATEALQSAFIGAIPNWSHRARYSHVLNVPDAGAGMFPVAAACALREVFRGVQAQHHVFELAPGLTLPAHGMLSFAESAKWGTDCVDDAVRVVFQHCSAEERLTKGGAQ